MPDRNIQMKKSNGVGWDNMYPVTLSTNVFDASGVTVEKSVKESAYIEGIKKETLYDDVTKTTYYLVTIPYLDKKGQVNKIQRGFANDVTNNGSLETARSFAKRHNASLVVNASIYNTSTNKLEGMQIQDGVIINSLPTRADRFILGIKDDGTLKYYDPTTAGATIIADGCKTALTSFLPLINNGAKVPKTIFDTYSAATWAYRRQVIAQLSNKDYIILSTESDTLGNVGFNLDDCVRVLLAKGATFAFMLDGGGSMQTVVRGTNITSLKDDAGKTERIVPDFLYFAKAPLTDRDITLAETNSDIGDVKTKLAQLEVDVYDKTDMNQGYMKLKGASDYVTQGIEIWKGDVKQYKLALNEGALGFYDYVAGKYLFQVGLSSGDIITNGGAISSVYQYAVVANDLNFITKSGWVWATTATLNSPGSTLSWAIQTIALNTQAAIQIATCFSSPYAVKKRRMNAGAWAAWE